MPEACSETDTPILAEKVFFQPFSVLKKFLYAEPFIEQTHVI